jgi:nucleotide-binding universal stress UspA family protein
MDQPLQPLRALLVGVDLSDSSTEVLRSAAHLAARTGAALHVVHATGLDIDPDFLPARHSFPDRVEAVEVALEEFVAEAIPASVPVASAKVRIDLAHRALVASAIETSADLIVLGPHRNPGLEQRVLGSTADRVLRTSPVPCLLVRGQLNLPFRRAIVPIDLSEPAREALETALWLCHAVRKPDRWPTDLRVVHVLPHYIRPVGDMAPGHARVESGFHGIVQEVLSQPHAADGMLVREELLWGDSAAVTTLAYARELGADLLALGTHGRGAIARFLIGSVASAVTREAACSVLVVPPGRWKQEGSALLATAEAPLASRMG